jgi:hypothetical protein
MEVNMKKILLVGLIVAALSLAVGFGVPAFGHSPMEESSGIPDQGTWQAMHEACEEADWDAMVEAAEQVHEDLGYAPCHDYYYPASEDVNPNRRGAVTGGHMGGWGGMMG